LIRFAEQYYSQVFLFVTAFLLVESLRSADSGFVIPVLVLGVVLLGFPHGALDPLVAVRALGSWRYFSVPAFAAAYLAIGALYGSLWWMWPEPCLAIFLAISAFHFGGDWQARGAWWTRFAYGSAIVTLPALLHSPEVSRIYFALGVKETGTILSISQWIAVVAAVLGLLAAAMQWRERSADFFEFVAITLGAALLEPLLFFTSYFCLLHSPHHLLDTCRSTWLRTARALTSAVLPALATTLAIGAIVWFAMLPGKGDENILRLVFVGLASLTLPHMMLQEIAKRRHL